MYLARMYSYIFVRIGESVRSSEANRACLVAYRKVEMRKQVTNSRHTGITILKSTKWNDRRNEDN